MHAVLRHLDTELSYVLSFVPKAGKRCLAKVCAAISNHFGGTLMHGSTFDPINGSKAIYPYIIKDPHKLITLIESC